MKKAEVISEVSQALSPQPLVDSVEFAQFYQPRFEDPMADPIAIFINKLRQSHGSTYFQRFLTGHSGTGKSTEITRLSRELSDHFEFVRIRAQEELSPFSTQPFDLLEVMAVRLVERADELKLDLSADLLQHLKSWFAAVTETEVQAQQRDGGLEAEAGVGVPGLMRSVLNLGSKVKVAAKFSGERKEEIVRKRLQRIAELIQLSNHLYREANQILRQQHRKEWVFLVEDLDKLSVSEAVVETLFAKYANIWPELRVHFLCTVPLWLAFGEIGAQLPFPCRAIVDIPVFDQEHRPYQPGRDIVRRILDQRVNPELFADGVREQLIQAGGGHFRDTFALVIHAADFAEVSGLPRIEERQAARAINAVRNDYMRRLGSTSSEHAVPYEEKAKLLVEIYEARGKRIVQSPVLYQLLRARVVHEYNDTYWYGLPPLVVDILIQQGYLKEGSPGGLEPPSA